MSELSQKVKNGLVKEYTAKKKKDDAHSKQKNLEDIAANIEWKAKKSLYKQSRTEAISKLTKVHVDLWEQENKEKSNVREQNGTNEDVKKVEEEYKEKKAEQLEEKFNQALQKKLNEYIKAAKELKGKTIRYENEKKYVLNQAEKRFSQVKNETMDKIQSIYKKSLVAFDAQKKIDESMRELSNLPMKIEEKIGEIKDLLDKLLGNLNFDPTSPDFDVDQIVAMIEATVKPVLQSTRPLQSVGGKIPVIGELMGIVQLLQSQNKPSTPLTDEQIREMCPKPPSLPPGLKEKADGIQQDITQMCMMFPMIYINLILQIVNIIWQKLNIITKIIPLGSMFPMNLIPQAITAAPKIMQLIATLPIQLRMAVMGIIQRKLQEAAALAFPKPNIDPGMLKSMIEDVKENTPTKEVSTEVKKNFSQVSKEFYENVAKDKGYTEYQIKQIQKNYKAIYDDSKTKIKTFKDDGDQDLAATEGSFLDMLKASAGVVMNGASYVGIGSGPQKSGENDKLGYKKGDDIDRTAKTPEDYENFLNSEILPKMEQVSAITYPNLYKTQDLMGEFYKTFQDQLTALGNEVVLYDTMKPAIGNETSLFKLK